MRPVKYNEGWYERNMANEGAHQCKRCGKYGDPQTAFYPTNKNPHVCRYCWAKDGRQRRQRNPEAERQRVKAWRAKQGEQ